MEKLNLIPMLKKYRYALIVLAAGLILLMLPTGSKEKPIAETVVLQEQKSIAQELEDILSQIQGAGRVAVMLTPASGQETVYQTDRSGENYDTVTVTDDSRNENGLICQINPPVYMGAIIVCQGGDNPSVRLAVVEAVAKVTGLGADRISVLKMK